MNEEKKLDERALEDVSGGGIPSPVTPDEIQTFKTTFCPRNCNCCRNQHPSQCYYSSGAEGAFWAGQDARGTCPGFASW